MKNMLFSCGLIALALAGATYPAAAEDGLAIRGEEKVVTIETEDGAFDITRKKTDAALIGGVLQPLVPVPGVTPVGELEVLEALETKSAKVVDMRTLEWRTQATIPGSLHIPYTEVAGRLDELGCTGSSGSWDCSAADDVIAFCNGPACAQSPIAIRAMAREGYPAEKIYYYRGGMQSWTVLGLSTAEDMF
ncbi:rhodanese-like domain-containing protein [Roseibium sp.]|uniref:rhodanese-like domain-containing protein n=1 Tax=Roseibium sp. TaxID=1936156 RepID=UPI003A98145C